jgi:hypothetical protein
MKDILLLAGIALLALTMPAGAQEAPTAADVLARSIGYHDPHGLWNRARFRLEIRETRPDGGERRTRVQFDLSKNAFEILTHRDGAVIEGLIADDDCVLTLNGSLEFSDEEREKYRLTCERIAWMRDYYTYLWGLPMKLRDPGTRIDAPAAVAEFQEQPVWSIRVTYDEAVGSDTWYFYFDQETYALAGYRFYHNEADNDGEYILLEGEIESDGLRIPARRSWYTHAEGRHLGDDILVEIGVSPR